MPAPPNYVSYRYRRRSLFGYTTCCDRATQVECSWIPPPPNLFHSGVSIAVRAALHRCNCRDRHGCPGLKPSSLLGRYPCDTLEINIHADFCRCLVTGLCHHTRPGLIVTRGIAQGRRGKVGAACDQLGVVSGGCLPVGAMGEDDWYSIPAHTYLVEGTLPRPTFAHTDLESADVQMPGDAAGFKPLIRAVWLPVAARVPSILASGAIVLLTLQSGATCGAAGMVAAALVATDNFLVISGRTASGIPGNRVLSVGGMAVSAYSPPQSARRAASAEQPGGGVVGGFSRDQVASGGRNQTLYLWQGGITLWRGEAWLFALSS